MAEHYPTFPGGPPERAWYAWQCLPRDEKGAPPSVRSIEERHHLAHATLSKLFKADSKLDRANHDRTERIAAALATTTDWLLHGRGTPPSTPWRTAPWPGPKKTRKSGTMRAARGG